MRGVAYAALDPAAISEAWCGHVREPPPPLPLRAVRRRVASASHLNVPTVSSSASLSTLVESNSGGIAAGAHHGHQPSADFGAMTRQGSGTLVGRTNGGAATIAPAMELENMTMLRPVMLHKCDGARAAFGDGMLCAGWVGLRCTLLGGAPPWALFEKGCQHGLSPHAARPQPRPRRCRHRRRIHLEPLSDILFTEEAIFTACQAGSIKCWLRPKYAQQME